MNQFYKAFFKANRKKSNFIYTGNSLASRVVSLMQIEKRLIES